MKKSCMNSTYSVTLGSIVGREKMREVRKAVATRKSKKR